MKRKCLQQLGKDLRELTSVEMNMNYITERRGSTLTANFPGSVILNRVFGFTKLGFPYKINVFRTFLLKMCGFFAILIE